MNSEQAIQFSERFQAAFTKLDLLTLCDDYKLPHSANASYYELRAEINLLALAWYHPGAWVIGSGLASGKKARFIPFEGRFELQN